mmetsp:Transcript_9867/g.19845  ORF Transcript_9867/g.19845 Transcript_9867/m.19845 type:complete len:728 (+) Transcript_9867:1713-3896(+)
MEEPKVSAGLARGGIVPADSHPVRQVGDLRQQLQPPRQHRVHPTQARKLQVRLQLLLPHAQPQQVARRHVAVHDLHEQVIQRLVRVRDQQNALVREIVVQKLEGLRGHVRLPRAWGPHDHRQPFLHGGEYSRDLHAGEGNGVQLDWLALIRLLTRQIIGHHVHGPRLEAQHAAAAPRVYGLWLWVAALQGRAQPHLEERPSLSLGVVALQGDSPAWEAAPEVVHVEKGVSEIHFQTLVFRHAGAVGRGRVAVSQEDIVQPGREGDVFLGQAADAVEHGLEVAVVHAAPHDKVEGGVDGLALALAPPADVAKVLGRVQLHHEGPLGSLRGRRRLALLARELELAQRLALLVANFHHFAPPHTSQPLRCHRVILLHVVVVVVVVRRSDGQKKEHVVLPDGVPLAAHVLPPDLRQVHLHLRPDARGPLLPQIRLGNVRHAKGFHGLGHARPPGELDRVVLAPVGAHAGQDLPQVLPNLVRRLQLQQLEAPHEVVAHRQELEVHPRQPKGNHGIAPAIAAAHLRRVRRLAALLPLLLLPSPSAGLGLGNRVPVKEGFLRGVNGQELEELGARLGRGEPVDQHPLERLPRRRERASGVQGAAPLRHKGPQLPQVQLGTNFRSQETLGTGLLAVCDRKGPQLGPQVLEGRPLNTLDVLVMLREPVLVADGRPVLVIHLEVQQIFHHRHELPEKVQLARAGANGALRLQEDLTPHDEALVAQVGPHEPPRGQLA